MKRILAKIIGLFFLLVLVPLSSYAAFSDSTLEQTGGPTCYMPGTAELCFTVTNRGEGPDDGMGTVMLTFPSGWTVGYKSQNPTFFEPGDITDGGNFIRFSD
ncbi:MAG: hypothetical protein JRK53_20495 [Deltaproteobacteria bacterium]|nr:hypothetical protein [Deltaproteobacteria bacterium]MBW1815750.1 hypothetical protein [Deltaproteobacteria bacterium]